MSENLEFDKKRPAISADEILEDITVGNWSLMKPNYVKAVQYYIEKAKHFDRVYDLLIKKEKDLSQLKHKLIKQIAHKNKLIIPAQVTPPSEDEPTQMIVIPDEGGET